MAEKIERTAPAETKPVKTEKSKADKQTLKNVVVACVVMIVSGIVLWAFDQLAMVIVNALISIGK